MNMMILHHLDMDPSWQGILRQYITCLEQHAALKKEYENENLYYKNSITELKYSEEYKKYGSLTEKEAMARKELTNLKQGLIQKQYDLECLENEKSVLEEMMKFVRMSKRC